MRNSHVALDERKTRIYGHLDDVIGVDVTHIGDRLSADPADPRPVSSPAFADHRCPEFLPARRLDDQVARSYVRPIVLELVRSAS
jgi:hypothetical protein